eukprot:Gb_22543 [translate_table: standard]
MKYSECHVLQKTHRNNPTLRSLGAAPQQISDFLLDDEFQEVHSSFILLKTVVLHCTSAPGASHTICFSAMSPSTDILRKSLNLSAPRSSTVQHPMNSASHNCLALHIDISSVFTLQLPLIYCFRSFSLPPPKTGDSVPRPSITGEEPQPPLGTGDLQLSRQWSEGFPSYGSLDTNTLLTIVGKAFAVATGIVFGSAIFTTIITITKLQLHSGQVNSVKENPSLLSVLFHISSKQLTYSCVAFLNMARVREDIEDDLERQNKMQMDSQGDLDDNTKPGLADAQEVILVPSYTLARKAYRPGAMCINPNEARGFSEKDKCRNIHNCLNRVGCKLLAGSATNPVVMLLSPSIYDGICPDRLFCKSSSAVILENVIKLEATTAADKGLSSIDKLSKVVKLLIKPGILSSRRLECRNNALIFGICCLNPAGISPEK